MLLTRLPSAVLLVAVAAAVAGCEDAERTSNIGERTAPSQPALSLAVSPSTGGRHDRFTVTITTRRAAGVAGKTRRTYVVEAHTRHPASACVNERDRGFPAGPAGRAVRAELDPGRGEGGSEGWCPGLFHGTVTYREGFACPPTGTCRPPNGFPTRQRVVARFSFRVR